MRGGGTLPASASSAAPARGPDTRTIEIALGGRPDGKRKNGLLARMHGLFAPGH